jgi:plastocyanin
MNALLVRTLPLVSGLLLIGGCSSGDSDLTAPPNDNDSPPTNGSDASVDVRDDFFSPASTSVDQGETVRWTWNGSNQHNVTWPEADLTNSPTQSTGSHQVTMPDSSGEYVYFCTIHGSPTGGMRGTINVR